MRAAVLGSMSGERVDDAFTSYFDSFLHFTEGLAANNS